MESRIENKVADSIKIAESKFKEDDTVKKFEETKERFQELVKKGIASERGNNLLSLSDKTSINKISYNSI